MPILKYFMVSQELAEIQKGAPQETSSRAHLASNESSVIANNHETQEAFGTKDQTEQQSGNCTPVSEPGRTRGICNICSIQCRTQVLHPSLSSSLCNQSSFQDRWCQCVH